jgi:hypothetical protein
MTAEYVIDVTYINLGVTNCGVEVLNFELSKKYA